MKKSASLILLFFIAGLAPSFAQRTFEKLLNVSSVYDAEQNPDGTYILAYDSGGAGVMKLDACGNELWTSTPRVRNMDEAIQAVSADPVTGGYVAGGYSLDTAGSMHIEPYIMLLDSNGNYVNSRILTPGPLGGATWDVSSTQDSGYVVTVYQDQFGGINSSYFGKLDMNLADEWSIIGSGCNILPSSVNISPGSQYTFASFDYTAANAPAIRLIDELGMLQNTFVIPDTFQGGGMFLRNAVLDHTRDGNYIAGATLTPTLATYNYPYIVKLDDFLNVIWQKIFDWGTSVEVLSVLDGPGNGVTCMINRNDTIVFMHLNNNGDSTWSRTYSGIGTVKANFMRHTADGGYLVNGSTSDGTDFFGFALKLDSLCQLLPPVCVEADGPTVVCPGSSVTLTADSGYTYFWSTGDTTQSVTVNAVGIYSVVVMDTLSGLSAQSEDIVLANFATSNPVINLLGTFLASTAANSYQWLLNGDTIPGANAQQYTPLQNGDYTVIVEDSNGCVLYSAPYTFIMPGVFGIDRQASFVISRNDGQVLEVKVNASDAGVLRLTDLRGKVIGEYAVRSGQDQRSMIPTASLSAGIYSLSWTSGKNMQVEKILIRH